MGPCPRLKWSLCKIFFFLFSKWFCTDIILYFKNPLHLPLPTLTHNVSITINKNKQRSCTSCQVCKIPARIIHAVIQEYTLLSIRLPLLLTFHLLSRCLFVFLHVKLPKVSSTYNWFFKVNECCFYCSSKFIPFYLNKIHYYCYSGNCQQNYFLRWL